MTVDSDGLTAWPPRIKGVPLWRDDSAPERDLSVTAPPLLSNPASFGLPWVFLPRTHLKNSLHSACFPGNPRRHVRLGGGGESNMCTHFPSSHPPSIVTSRLLAPSTAAAYITKTVKFCSLLSQIASYDYHSCLINMVFGLRINNAIVCALA